MKGRLLLLMQGSETQATPAMLSRRFVGITSGVLSIWYQNMVSYAISLPAQWLSALQPFETTTNSS